MCFVLGMSCLVFPSVARAGFLFLFSCSQHVAGSLFFCRHCFVLCAVELLSCYTYIWCVMLPSMSYISSLLFIHVSSALPPGLCLSFGRFFPSIGVLVCPLSCSERGDCAQTVCISVRWYPILALDSTPPPVRQVQCFPP